MRPTANSDDDTRVVLLLRVIPSLKARLAAYARERGLTLNAAATILIDRELQNEENTGRPG